MALKRVLTYQERGELLNSLVELNNRAKRIYEFMAGQEVSPVDRFNAAAQILNEAAGIAANLEWTPQAALVPSEIHNFEGFTTDPAGWRVYGVDSDQNTTQIDLFSFIATGDTVRIKNALDAGRNGVYTVSVIVPDNLTMVGLNSWVTGTSITETALELVLYERYSA